MLDTNYSELRKNLEKQLKEIKESYKNSKEETGVKKCEIIFLRKIVGACKEYKETGNREYLAISDEFRQKYDQFTKSMPKLKKISLDKKIAQTEKVMKKLYVEEIKNMKYSMLAPDTELEENKEELPREKGSWENCCFEKLAGRKIAGENKLKSGHTAREILYGRMEIGSDEADNLFERQLREGSI